MEPAEPDLGSVEERLDSLQPLLTSIPVTEITEQVVTICKGSTPMWQPGTTQMEAVLIFEDCIGVTIAPPPWPKPTTAIRCPQNSSKFVRWSGNSADFDVDHGGFPSWWETEFIHANGIWDRSSVGSDLNFVLNYQSNNDWYKKMDRTTTRKAEA